MYMGMTEERFMSYVIPVPFTGCWLWLGGMYPSGYGNLRDRPNKDRVAHRWSYRHFVGAIPEGMQIDHLCRVRLCVNPRHLEVVTNRENCRRGIAGALTTARQLAKTHCPQGHPYSGSNLYIGIKTKARFCKTCTRLCAARKRERDKRAVVTIPQGE